VIFLRIGLAVIIFISNAAYADGRHFSLEFDPCLKSSSIDSQPLCINNEIIFQKNRLNFAYSRLVKKISPEDANYLNKVQHDWITWRDANYTFLSEHVAGEFSTTRATSLNFLLNSVYDRADDLEMILDEIGN
jgi:uncharacterized protein YecT (DUF1311 family)